ncbi:MAG: MG2 domain-containing protein, partial [Longimicrobiales bacterium]
MLTAALAALVSLGPIVTPQSEPLRVLRSSPNGTVDPVVEVVITFDRPVAASLNQSLDPRQIFSIEPPVEGTLEWRDPVTIRFTPAAPLPPRAGYNVTISNDFQAMDGSRLERPFTLSFRITGPKVIGGWPASQNNTPQYLTYDEHFELLVSPPPDSEMLAALARSSRLEFARGCRPRIVRLGLVGERPFTEEDQNRYRRFTRRPPYRDHPELLRVVELQPEAELPAACSGTLVTPENIERPNAKHRWALRTHGTFAIDSVSCGRGSTCPTGPIRLHFTTPVRGADVLSHVTVHPDLEFTVRNSDSERAQWALEAELEPRKSYVVVIDTTLTDVFGQRITGAAVRPVATTGMAAATSYPRGRWLVEREGSRTIAVGHVNVDSLEVKVVPIPRSLEARFASGSSWSWRQWWDSIADGAPRRVLKFSGEPDERYVTGIRLPAYSARRPNGPTLMALRLTILPDDGSGRSGPVTVAQVTDLAVHARLGFNEGLVWVTGVSDGLPRPGAQVSLYANSGREVATAQTDEEGVALLRGYKSGVRGFEGYVAATLGDDRSITGIESYDPYLSPWRFNVSSAYGYSRRPMAGAVFTERDIYRPGESVYAKAIVRRGNLGALTAPAGDSLRWKFLDRDAGALMDTTVVLSRFGTADLSYTLTIDAPLGEYQVKAEIKVAGSWRALPRARYRVAEYRPPEFLVDATSDGADRFTGDPFDVDIEARYLFGAPMGRAAVSWVQRQQSISAWNVRIPNTDGFFLGVWGRWWEGSSSGQGVRTISSGQDTLDADGHLRLSLNA